MAPHLRKCQGLHPPVPDERIGEEALHRDTVQAPVDHGDREPGLSGRGGPDRYSEESDPVLELVAVPKDRVIARLWPVDELGRALRIAA